MDKPTCSKRKYTFLVTVEIENGGWPEADGWPYLPKSDQAVKDGVRDGILMYEYGDVWGFKNVSVKDAPIDILNTPMKDIKAGVIEDPWEEYPLCVEVVFEIYGCSQCGYDFAVEMPRDDYKKMIDKRLNPFCPNCGMFIEGSEFLNERPDESIKCYKPLSLSWHHI
jgi:hypothetical protein